MAGWRAYLGGLFGDKPAAQKPKPQIPSQIAATQVAGRAKKPVSVADSPRAKLIAGGLAIHRAQGAALRATLDRTIADLERAAPRGLSDPAVMDRLLSLVRARRSLGAIMAGDLRRYLVLANLRHWLEEGGGKPPTHPPKGPTGRKATVVRRG